MPVYGSFSRYNVIESCALHPGRSNLACMLILVSEQRQRVIKAFSCLGQSLLLAVIRYPCHTLSSAGVGPLVARVCLPALSLPAVAATGAYMGRSSAVLQLSGLLLLLLAALASSQGGSSPSLVPPLPGEVPGGTSVGTPPPGAAGPPLELPSDATALPEQGGQPPGSAAFPPTPSGGVQLSPAPPSGFGLAPGIGAPAGKLATVGGWHVRMCCAGALPASPPPEPIVPHDNPQPPDPA